MKRCFISLKKKIQHQIKIEFKIHICLIKFVLYFLNSHFSLKIKLKRLQKLLKCLLVILINLIFFVFIFMLFFINFFN